MANLIIQTPPQQTLVINHSTAGSGIISTNLKINDNFTNYISIIAIDRGLPGVSGPMGPQGIPGSGINRILINDVINLSEEYEYFAIVGSGGTTVSASGKTITISSNNPLDKFSSRRVISTNTYTIAQLDNNQTLIFNSNNMINVDIPDNLLEGFNCMIIQIGDGQVVFSGNTLSNRLGHTKLSGKYSVGNLFKPISDIIILDGDTGN